MTTERIAELEAQVARQKTLISALAGITYDGQANPHILLIEQNSTIKQLREELGRRATNDHLTEMKTDGIIGMGYKLSGYVVNNERGERGIIEMSAVRWLSNKEMWDLMHPENLPPISESDVTAALTAARLLNTVESRKDMRAALEVVFRRNVRRE